MRLSKIILSAATLSLSLVVTAQQVHVGGYADFSSTAAAQVISKKGDANWEHTDVFAEFGPVQNGIHFLNLDATARNVDLHTGVWLGSGIGPWYSSIEYYDRTSYDGTADNTVPLMQLYLVTHFFNDQLRFYSGGFAGNGFNAGYVFGGYAGASAHVDALAMRGENSDAAFSGLEVQPLAISGFRMIAGFPVAPVITHFDEFNELKNLYKAVKFMASYKWMAQNITFNAGIRPHTYYTSNAKADYTESKFGEAFVQADFPSLFYNFPFRVSYDFRWRDQKSKALKNPSDEESVYEWSQLSVANIFMASVNIPHLIPGWTLAIDDRFGYYGDHYIALNEKAVYNCLNFALSHNITGTPYMFGFNGAFMYGQDANGTSMSHDDALCSDLISYSWNFMNGATNLQPIAGEPGRYMSVYVYPYIQKNFQNGRATFGVELQYSHLEAKNEIQSFTWRVPVGLAFWW